MSIHRLNVGVTLSMAIVAATGVLASFSNALPTRAQIAQSQPLTIFENVTLSPGFSPDPTTVRGISGGPRPASDLAGRADTATGPCIGYIDEQPDHTVTLTEFFDYLSLQVESADDTTIVVRGPGGTWCNDDYNGVNPGIAGQWLSGTYEVWVGSYETNQYSPYVIRISDSR
ncbi:hypothetical protein H6G89_33960 [Oscillatoria sp. FACHB-1407]|nr:hypothetical protein [Oscillatoria sp. FACHB-1407]MBD2465993.1 hypothetical protein [Oscillatoria sp. FACHB-1407]